MASDFVRGGDRTDRSAGPFIAVACVADSESLRLSRSALESIRNREGESITEWAERLARDVAGAND